MATNLSAFLKKNKKYKDDVAYKVTASLCDENGTPLDWKIKAVSTEEYERIERSVQQRFRLQESRVFTDRNLILHCLLQS